MKDYTDIVNRSKKKKHEEENKNSSSRSYDATSIVKKTQLGSKVNFDTFENDLKEMGTKIGSIYGGWQTQETMQNTRSAVESMYNRISAYQEYNALTGNKGTDLSELLGGYKSVMDDWDNLSSVYGQYKDADSYGKAKQRASFDKQFSGLTYDEVQAEKEKYGKDSAEYDYLSNYTNYASYADFEKALANVEKAEKPKTTKASTYLEGGNNKGYAGSSYSAMGSAPEKKKEETYAEKLERASNLYKLDNIDEKWLAVADEKDFAEKSKYKEGNSELYEYINDVNGARSNILAEHEKIQAMSQGGIYTPSQYVAMGLDAMDEKEIGIFNALYEEDKRKGTNKANEYLEDIEVVLTKRIADKDREDIQKAVDDEKYGALNSVALSLASPIMNVGGSIYSGIDSIGSIGKEKNPYNIYNSVTNMAGDIRSEVGANIEENTDLKIGDVNVASFLYGTGMSMADSALGAFSLGKAYTPLMGMSAYQQTARELTDAGASQDEVATLSLISGIAEAGFEYASIDNLFKIKNTDEMKKVLVNGLKQAGVESLEEVGTELVNVIANEWVLGANSEYAQKYEDLIARGYSEQEARQEISSDFIGRLVEAGAGGALSGGIMGTGYSALQLQGLDKTGKELKANDRTQDIMGMFTPEEAETYALYSEYANKGVNADNISDAQLGNLYTTKASNAYDVLNDKKSTAEQKEDAYRTLDVLNTYSTTKGEVKPVEAVAKADTVQAEAPKTELDTYTEGMSEEKAKLFTEQYNGGDIEQYKASFDFAYERGVSGYTLTDIMENKGNLTERQVVEIYKGTAQAKVQKEQQIREEISAKYGKNLVIEGKFDDSIIDYTNTVADGSKVQWKNLTTSQKSVVRFAKAFSKASGVDITFTNKGMEEGYNGKYENGVVVLDINAGIDKIDGKAFKDSLIPTMSHEVTHWMKDKSPVAYRNMLEYATETMALAQKLSVNDLIAGEIARIEKVHPELKGKVTEEYAMDEILARTCEDMLSNSKTARELLNRMTKAEQQTFIDKVKGVFNDLMEWVDDLLSKYKSHSKEAQILALYKEEVENMSAMWDKALAEAVVNNSAMKAEGKTAEGEATNFSDRDSEYSALDDEVNEIRKQYRSASEELKKYQLPKIDYEAENIDAEIEAYKKWEDESGYGVAYKKADELKNKLRDAERRLSNLGDELRKDMYTSFTEEDVKKYVSKAVRRYHTTSMLSKASYLVTTGSMLDFSDGQRYRVKDHREISEILDLPDYAEYSDGMIVFMNMGNIRLQEYGVDISTMPNSKQITALRNIIYTVLRNNDEFYLDVSDERGNNVFSMTYGAKTSASKIISDIQNYFKDGTIPEQPSGLAGFYYSDRDSDGNTLTKEQIEHFKNSEARDEKGRLVPVYHGTVREFYTFDREYGNPEGNMGKGFYFTNSIEDVERNYANEDGADLTNKIEREAEMLEYEEEYEGMEHDEIVEALRKKYITAEEPITLECYLNIEKPCYVGSRNTYLFDDIADNYDIDDYEDEDDYYADVDQTAVDYVDDAISAIYREGYDAEGVDGILYEAISMGGITLEDLKKQLGELYLEDDNGNLISNELARIIVESLGYDGIIDDSVSTKFKNMGLREDAVHYIVFNSNQAKLTTNENPTTNEDIRYSDRYVVPMVADRLLPSEWEALNKRVGLYNKGDVYPKSADGDIIIAIGNKLIYTDAKLGDVGVSKIIEFLSEHEDDIDRARSIIYDFEKGKSKLEDAYETIENYFGDGFVTEYSTGAVQKNERFDRRTKRGKSKSDAYHANFRQATIDKARRIAGFVDDDVTQFADREAVSIYDLMGENELLKKQNAEIKEDVERLKERLKLENTITHGNKFNENQLNAVAGHLRKLTNSSYDKKVLVEELRDVYTFIVTTPQFDWTDLMAKCYEVAENVLESSKGYKVTNDYFKSILSDIRSARISLDAEQMQEAEYAFGKDYRKRLFGRVTLSKNGTPLDQKWSEWSAMYPEIFDANVSPAQQIVELDSIYDSVREGAETYQKFNDTESIRSLAVEIYNQYWNVSTIRTMADKHDKEVKRLNYEHRKAMGRVRENYKNKVEMQKQTDAKRYGKIIDNIRKRNEAEVQKAKELGKKRLDAYKVRTEKNAKIDRIKKNAKSLEEYLNKNSKDKHIVEDLKPMVRSLVSAIDYETGIRASAGMEMASEDLDSIKASAEVVAGVRDEQKLLNSLYQVQKSLDRVEFYGLGIEGEIENLVSYLEEMRDSHQYPKMVLNALELDQLETVDKLVRAVKSVVMYANKLHTIKRNLGVDELGAEITHFLDKLGLGTIYKGVLGKYSKVFKWLNTVPYYAFNRLGSGGKVLFGSLQDGWDKLAFNVKMIFDFADATYTKKEVEEWSKGIKEVTIGGKVYRMTVSQMMSLYCLSNREQAMKHILGNGIRIANFEDGMKVVNQPTDIKMTMEDIEYIKSMLTPKQIEVANKIQEFMSTFCSEWGNQVSMERFGYKAFGETNYFPIEVNDNNLSKDKIKDNKNVSLYALLNMGFTKSLNENSTNAIMVNDIFDVFANHASEMAKYNALGLAVLDFNRVMNYSEMREDNPYSIRTAMEQAYGKDAEMYFNKLIADLNGSQNVSRDVLGKGMAGRAKLGAIGFNIKTVLLQPTAYLKASAILNKRYLVNSAITKPHLVKRGIDRAKKYCGIALWKSMGFYDTNISRGVVEQIKKQESFMDTMAEASTKWMEKADEITFGALWNACELEIKDTRKDLKVGSEEYFHAVAERLREVIYATQVVDSTLTRSEMMRSGDTMDKLLTAFGSEPILAYNMLLDCVMTHDMLKRGKASKEELQKQRRKVARVLDAYIATNLVVAILEATISALRDEDELEEEEVVKMFFENFMANMGIIGKIPYLKDVVSIFQGYSPSRFDTQGFQSLYYAVNSAKKNLEGEGSIASTIKHSLKSLSSFSGIGIFNAYRDVMALLYHLDIFSAEELEEILDEIK